MKYVQLVLLPGTVCRAGQPDGSVAGLAVNLGAMHPDGRTGVCGIPSPATSGAFSSFSSVPGIILRFTLQTNKFTVSCLEN